MDLNDWNTVDANGSARSPSVVESLSTSSGFSSYAGSSANSPSRDVGFTSQELEQPEFHVAHVPTAPSAGDTMHDMVATGHHGTLEVTPVSWDMGNPMSSNEIALQNDFETLDQMQFNTSQSQDFGLNTMPSIPNTSAIMMQRNVNPSSET